MIRLDQETAITIEEAAAGSLKEHADTWKSITKEELLTRQDLNLSKLIQFDGIPLNQILDGMSADEFMSTCVRLAIIQTLLNGKPGYRRF